MVNYVDFISPKKKFFSIMGTKSVLLQSSGEVTLPKLTWKAPIYNFNLLYKELTDNDSVKLKIIHINTYVTY